MMRNCVGVALLRVYEDPGNPFEGTRNEQAGWQLVGANIGHDDLVVTKTVHSLNYCSVNLERGRGPESGLQHQQV